MAKSVETSSQFKLLPKRVQDLINQDMMDDPVDAPSFAFSPNGADIKMPTQGTVFKDDTDSYAGTVGPLTRADVGVQAALPKAPTGALSAVTAKLPQREPTDFATMLAKFVPQDDSSSKYLAMAAALGQPTGFGSFGEKMANVSNALLEQKQNQEKLRAQYTPLIMQHVAQQQAREEQAAYRLEAQQLAHQAQVQAAQIAQQGRIDLAAQNQAAMDERAKADRLSRELIAADRATAAGEAKTTANKPPAGYDWGPNAPDGTRTQVVIKGGPADLKAVAQAEQRAAGSAGVNSAVATLRDAYNRLEQGNGITSTENGMLANIPAAISASGLGQSIGKIVGSSNQSARNDIAMTRPALLAALMKANNMSARQVDSNAELKLWLATATDPALDVQANRRALDKIEQKYLGGDQPPAEATPKASTLPSQDAIAAEMARRKKG